VRKLRTTTLLAAGSLALGTIAGVAIAAASAASGTVKHYKIVERTFVVNTNHSRLFDVKCPRGYVPVSGGGHVGTNGWAPTLATQSGISASDVDLSHRGWAVTAYVVAPEGNTSFTADAVCATP
jgi:hypothetical protein